MVKGLEKFRAHFAGYADQYVLIGGTATFLALSEAALQARATKDLDIVLCVEALNPDFVAAFWAFVKEGAYENRQRSTGERTFYRFDKPADETFPAMLELFSRKPDNLELDEAATLTPIPVDEDLSSLSAILLDDDYYRFIHAHKKEIEGLPIVSEQCLIPLKTRAWLDLTARREAGAAIDSKNINKHRGDVLRLSRLLVEGEEVRLPDRIRADMNSFLAALEKQDGLDLKSMGLQGTTLPQLIGVLRSVFCRDGA